MTEVDRLSAVQRKLWEQIPVDWEFMPAKVKPVSLSYLRLQGLVETRYAGLPDEPAKRGMRWKRKTR